MRAHLDGIGPLSLSADGRLLAMGDFNGRMAIFDVRSRRPLPGSFQAQAGVGDLALSPDGSLLAVALQEGGLVQLWDVRSATLRHQLRTDLPDVGVSFSPDQRSLVTVSVEDLEPGVARAVMSRWDVGNGRRLAGPVSVSTRGADAFAATPDGARLVVVNGAEVVQVTPETLQPVRRLPRTPQRTGPMVAALSPDGRMVALGAEDGTVQLLDLATGRFRGAAGRHESPIGGVAFSADGTMLATGGGDRRVIVRDVASGQVRETFQGGEGRFAGLRFSPDGRTLYAAAPRSVIAWDLEGAGRLGRPFSVSGPTDLTMAVSPDGSVTATPDGPAGDQVSLRELRTPRKVRRSLAPGIGRIGAIAFAPDGQTLALGGDRAHGAPVLVDTASDTVTRPMTGGHDDGFVTLAFDPEGKRILTAGNDRRAIIWDARTGAQLLELRHPGEDEFNGTVAAWSPDGTVVATAGGGGTVALWRVADGAPVRTVAADPEFVNAVAFSPDGTLLAAAGSGERFATLWEVASGRLVGRLRHPTYVVAVRFDPRGRTLATAATGGTVRLWDVASRRQLGVALPGPDHAGPDQWTVLAFNPGGTDLVVFYGDGTRPGVGRGPRPLEAASLHDRGRPADQGRVGGIATRPALPACLPVDQ
jgi:WD40 repeat protein